MQKIAIINLKGGVGKSITTINLAAEFAARGLRVLVVDLDKQANTTKFYDCLDYDMPSAADLLLQDATLEDCADNLAALDGPKGIDLVSANMRLLKANKQIMLDPVEPQLTRLRDALAPTEQKYDIALFDCPPDLDMGSLNALTAANWALVPVDCDEWATDGLREISHQMEQIKIYHNPHLKLLGVVLTKYHHTKAAAMAVYNAASMGYSLMQQMIRYTTRVPEARSAHKPLREFAPDCTAAQDYSGLADEILQKIGVHSGHNTEG